VKVAWNLVAPLLALAGCRDGPEDVADRFVAAYFVEVSQDRALLLATGLATRKLQDELRLVREVRSLGYTPEQARSRVRYSRRTLRLSGGAAQAGYDIAIETAPGSTSRRSAYLVLRKQTDGWRVSNYDVSEAVPPRAR
jgi:hypothetical protein